ncbi:G8 domain-containing protein [Haloarchaeobius baliensis]|uniref:G8 domain-containing protein n=1 Tax=Haloarchaeobius baliensis TaxID=1670458 RepID=UPI003F8850B4
MSGKHDGGGVEGGASEGDGSGVSVPTEQLRERRDELQERAPSRRAVLGTLGAGALGIGLGHWGIPALSDVVGGVEVPAASGSASPPGHHDPGNVLALVPESEVTHRASRDGRWDDPGTWGGSVPDDFARAQIPDDVTVTLSGASTGRLKTLRVDGALAFDPREDSHLRVETLVTTPESVLQIGREGRPVGRRGQARVTFADLGPIDEDWDPERLSTGLLALGEVRVHGAEKTTWTELASHPTSGATTLELDGAPTNWDEGDRLVVPGMNPGANEDEELFVTGIDGSRVSVDRRLDFDHVPPADDLPSYVLNLDRTIRFESESQDVPRRGHVMFMSQAVEVRYAAFEGLGRTDKSYAFTDPQHGNPPEDVPPNPRARYALHFHETGIDTDTAQTVEGVAVDGSPGWGVVNHHSYVDVTDSVTHDVFGAGFVAEAGNERGSFVGNFALRSEGSGDLPDSRDFDSSRDEHDPGDVDDFGHGGHGFWFQGPALTVEENVAAGHRHHGFVFWNRPLVDRELRPGEEIDRIRGTVANFPLEHVDEDRMPFLVDSDHVYDGKVSSAYVPLKSVRNNTTFASGGGMDLSRHQFGWSHERYADYSVVEGFTAFNVGPLVRSWGHVAAPDHGNAEGGNNGISVRYSHNLRVKDARLVWGRGREATEAVVDDEQADEHPERLESVGINRNTPYPFHVVFEGCEVEGFTTGAKPLPRGVTVYRDCRFDNDRDVSVEDGHHWPARRIKLENCTFAGDGEALSVGLDEPDDRGAQEVFADNGGVVLDGRQVYYDAQAPDHVPIPDGEMADQLGRGDLSELFGTDASNLVGKTNRELYAEYGRAVKGHPVPDHASRDERVAGGYVGGDPTGAEAWFDAENADVSEPFRVREDPSAATGRYVVAEGVDASGEPPSEGLLTYEFEVDAGRYRVWSRALGPSGEDDSFWLRVDDGDWIRWGGVGGRRSWAWERAPEPDTEDWHDRRLFDLDSGQHTLTVGFREDGARLDRLFVGPDGRTPIGLGRGLPEE